MRLERILEGKGGQYVRYAAYAGMVVFFIIDIVMPRHHLTFFWDSIPGFSSFYGFISCVVIIIVSKFAGRIWLQKKENYYDE